MHSYIFQCFLLHHEQYGPRRGDGKSRVVHIGRMRWHALWRTQLRQRDIIPIHLDKHVKLDVTRASSHARFLVQARRPVVSTKASRNSIVETRGVKAACSYPQERRVRQSYLTFELLSADCLVRWRGLICARWCEIEIICEHRHHAPLPEPRTPCYPGAVVRPRQPDRQNAVYASLRIVGDAEAPRTPDDSRR